MGKPLLSLLDAIECRKKRPDWPKACYRQGIALMSLKVGLKLRLLPCLPIVSDHYLVLYYQDYKGACESLLDALKLDPGSSELMDALRYLLSSLVPFYDLSHFHCTEFNYT